MKAPLPNNKSERLQASGKYRVLDTLPETAFDDLTFLTSQICGTPITLLTFINQERQRFKSKRGMNVSHTPHEDAFRTGALFQPDTLLIFPDAREDARFADNPLLTGWTLHPVSRGCTLGYSNGQSAWHTLRAWPVTT